VKQRAEDQPSRNQSNGHNPDGPSKGLRRPISISGSQSTVHKSSTKDVKKMKDPSKTAKEMIRDSSGVGADLHAVPSAARPPPQANSLGNVFLKPSGVDEPAHSAKGAHRDNEIISTVRPKTKKRERETASEPKEKEGKKRKKKKVVE
jgi:hypothetical protein